MTASLDFYLGNQVDAHFADDGYRERAWKDAMRRWPRATTAGRCEEWIEERANELYDLDRKARRENVREPDYD